VNKVSPATSLAHAHPVENDDEDDSGGTYTALNTYGYLFSVMSSFP
jgi:hypothetical protein